MNNKLYIIVSVVFLVLCSSPVNQPTPAIDRFLPKSNTIAGWIFDTTGTFGAYVGNANNTTQLQQRIDGGDQVYTQRGFSSYACQGYMKNIDDFICVQIFDQTNEANASSVYSYYLNNAPANYVPLSIANSSASLDTSKIGLYVIELYSSKYFVRVQNRTSKDANTQTTLTSFATAVVNAFAH